MHVYIYIQVCPFEKAGSLEAGWPIYTCFFVYIIDIYIYIYHVTSEASLGDAQLRV